MCAEKNVSGADRTAVLNAILPAWIKPMVNDLHEKLKKMSLDNLNLIH